MHGNTSGQYSAFEGKCRFKMCTDAALKPQNVDFSNALFLTLHLFTVFATAGDL